MASEGAASVRARTAPAEDHRDKPDSPTDLGGRAWRRTLTAAAGQFQRHLGTDLAALRELGTAATRQLAKRQITWLRSMPARRVVAAEAPEALEQLIALADDAATAGAD